MRWIWPALLLLLVGSEARTQQLILTDVQRIIAQSVSRAVALGPPLSTNAVIAVTDREGWVLAVWAVNTNLMSTNPLVAEAIAKAGTASFLSSGQNAFSSRTAGFIVQQHFPPGIANKPNGPLVGVNFSQLMFSDINKFKAAVPESTNSYGSSPGLGLVSPLLPLTGGLEGTPGGLPLYKSGALVGGIGVAGNDVSVFEITPAIIANPDTDEDVALAGQIGFQPSDVILGSQALINGIRLEYIESSTHPATVTPLPGTNVPPYYSISSPAPFPYPRVTLGGANGELRQPIIDDPSTVPLSNSVARLSAIEVSNILAAAANRARTTRAGIRLPRGVAAQMFISVVNNPNADGASPVVLGTFCTSPDTTRFSWDVAVQKARTAVFFSAADRAFSSRTVGFLAQGFYPPGIDGTEPGLFLGLQERFSIITTNMSFPFTNPVNGAVFNTSSNVNGNLPNGITIFPGGFPLYRNGVLIGAIGVSGDGVDQDDLVAAAGASLFLAPVPIRADQTQYRGARLPFAKFPRNPAL